MIPINKPFLPPKSEFDKYVEDIWNRIWLTNHGPLVQEFESEVSEYLNVKQMLYVNNGTTALQIAIKALGLEGEIITTPYSYVATTSTIVWQNCKPVFVDIDEENLNINPALIEDAITENTTAILATHIYGNPCDVERIREIADKHQLKVIYDAAHCFGVTYNGASIFEWGDISATSFHATKVFHTVEGGGLFTKNDDLFSTMKYIMNFGHDGLYKFREVGINGKNSELNAAMGLCNLKYVNQCLEKRKKMARYYDKSLKNLPVTRPIFSKKTEPNHAYYPIIFKTSEQREQVSMNLAKHQIETRSYFKPSLNTLSYVKATHVPVSESVSGRVLCLPFFYELTYSEIDKITELINKTI